MIEKLTVTTGAGFSSCQVGGAPDSVRLSSGKDCSSFETLGATVRSSWSIPRGCGRRRFCFLTRLDLKQSKEVNFLRLLGRW